MNENEIRDLLISYLSEKHSGEGSIAFIKEIFIDSFKCRVDLVLANGHAIAFEIKSELDSLNRLPSQIKSLTSHFDEVIVVCAEKHLANALDMVNDSIGVWVIKKDGRFRVEQKAKRQKPSKEHWLSHLPVDELKGFLRENALPRSGDRETLVNTATKESLSLIRQYVLDYFKRRDERISLINAKRKRIAVSQPYESHDKEFLTVKSSETQIKAIPRQVHY